MRISDWSSDVCSSDLGDGRRRPDGGRVAERFEHMDAGWGGAPELCRWSAGRPGNGRRRSPPGSNPGTPHSPGLWSPEGYLAAQKEPHPAGRPARRYGDAARSEERRGGKEGVSTCGARWLQYHSKKKKK